MEKKMSKWIKIKDVNKKEKLVNLDLINIITPDAPNKQPAITFINHSVDGQKVVDIWLFELNDERDMKYKELKVLLGIKDE
jgi:hypothetical protein